MEVLTKIYSTYLDTKQFIDNNLMVRYFCLFVLVLSLMVNIVFQYYCMMIAFFNTKSSCFLKNLCFNRWLAVLHYENLPKSKNHAVAVFYFIYPLEISKRKKRKKDGRKSES